MKENYDDNNNKSEEEGESTRERERDREPERVWKRRNERKEIDAPLCTNKFIIEPNTTLTIVDRRKVIVSNY